MPQQKVVSGVPAAPAANSAEVDSELSRLQEILYGNQARATEQRLNDLEQRLEAVRRELDDTIHAKIGKLESTTQDNLTKARKALTAEIEKQAARQAADLSEAQRDWGDRLSRQEKMQTALLREVQQELTAALDALRQELVEQIQATKSELSDRVDRLGADQSNRLLAFQNEARQRDEDLRQELLTLSAWLDDKKTSRHDLGQMLVTLGQNLQGRSEAAPQEND
ncbi:MAG: hypothetical protein Fur0021_06640 [Candidatus Promineifilaceae bacterium]